MILGDLGAEVIKVEPVTPSKFIGGGPSPKGEENRKRAAYFSPNRNKRSIAVDLRSDTGRHIFHCLAERSDVIIEGFRPGVAKRLGIDYDTIKGLNSGIIYCSLTGYGQDGPYCKLPGHDINYIGMAGALALIGPKEGPPSIPLNLVGDFAGASLYGAIGIMAALMARTKSGRGQYVDTAIMDSVISLLSFYTPGYFLHGVVPKRGEDVIQGAFPHNTLYETKDGRYITIACVEPHFWERLCRLWGKPEYIPYDASRVALNPRDDKWEQIRSELRLFFLTKTMDEWFGLLSQNDIPVGKVHNLDEVFSDPQVIARQMLLEVGEAAIGKVRQVGIAPKLSETPGSVRSLSPLLGEHTDEILHELGYEPQQIADYRKQGVVA